MRGHTETRWTDRAKAWAVVVALLCVPFAVAAFDSSALPGPSGGAAFTATGGTVTQPVVMTGDNAGGVGTLRIRPADEDTQFVLCEASNNASPEVCSSLQHSNVSSTIVNTGLISNGYMDSAGSLQRNNTSFGQTWHYATAGTTAANNIIGMRVFGTGGAAAGDVNMAATAAATSTLTIGALGTVTTDIRGPILNGGSATCNGLLAGSLCVSEPDGIVVAPTTGLTAIVSMKAPDTASQAGNVLYNSSNGVVGGLRYYGSTSILTAGQNKTAFFAQGTAANVIIGHGSVDVAAGSPLVEFMDGASFANTVATLDGAGNLFLNASATRTKGTITLVAGTGTATVSSGCVPACSDTTAIAAVQCSVSGTTLTANGTGTDVISYVCL